MHCGASCGAGTRVKHSAGSHIPLGPVKLEYSSMEPLALGNDRAAVLQKTKLSRASGRGQEKVRPAQAVISKAPKIEGNMIKLIK